MNIAGLADRWAGESPEAPALVREDAAPVSWRDFRRRVAALAGWMQARGIAPGDRVALLAANDPAFVEVVLACAHAGIAAVPLNWRLAAAEIADQLGDSEPKLLVHDAANKGLAEASGWRGATLDLSGADYARAAAGDVAPMESVGTAHTLGIFYTGGTTGRAKGVMLSHGNLLANAQNVRQLVRFRPGDVHLHVAPMFHLADLGYFFLQLLDGGAHLFQAQFRPVALFAAIARHRVTTTLLAPTMVGLALADPAHGRHDVSSWRLLEYGGSPIAAPVLRRALAEWPCRLYQGYGQTEATHTICTLPHDDHVQALAEPAILASCGRAAPGVELRIVDAADRTLPPGEIGELIVRGPTVMTGYWRRAAESASALRGGWLRTGDLGFFDADGRATLVDRKKDMIVTGAENVFSAEVEQALGSHPDVAECAVIGVPDAAFGERVHAVVLLKPGVGADAAALQAHCRALIAGFKVPRSFEFPAALPKTAFGKIVKSELRAAHWRGRDRSVA